MSWVNVKTNWVIAITNRVITIMSAHPSGGQTIYKPKDFLNRACIFF